MLFAVFISLFALDVFGEGYGFFEAILAFLVHLVPTYLVVIALLIAWKWEHIGGIIFILLGIFYIAFTWGRANFLGYLIVAAPVILIGALFLLNKFLVRKRRR